jgi:hypothetical protein
MGSSAFIVMIKIHTSRNIELNKADFLVFVRIAPRFGVEAESLA